MANINIQEEINELFEFFGIENNILDDESIPEKDSPYSPIENEKPRPEKWKGKWDYVYEKRPSMGTYRLPTEGGLLSRHHPISEEGGFATLTHPNGHEGYDIGNVLGTPVYAIGPGKVIKVYSEGNNKGGNGVVTEHEDGITSYYAHLDKVNVGVGDEVDQSTIIGTMGKSGNARGSVHLHWHLRKNNQPLSPEQIIGKPIGFSRKEAERKERLTKLARRYRLSVWRRLLLSNL